MTTVPTLARRTDGRPVYEHGPLALPLVLSGLRTVDGHTVDAYATLSVRLLATPGDFELFDEQLFVGRDRVTADDVRRRLAGPLAASLGEFAAGQGVDAVLRQHAAAGALLLGRAEAVGFGCGLAFMLVDLRLDSPSRQREIDRRQADAERLRAIEGAAAVAAKLRSLGPAAAAVDRPALLAAALRAAAARPWRAILTAGRNVLTLEAAGDLKIFPAPDAVGPLRCVRRLRADAVDAFAVGGPGGVGLMDARLAPVRVLPVSALNSAAALAASRGYNAVVVRPATGEIMATHGDSGLTVWDRDGVARRLASPGPPRLLTRVDDRVLLAVGGQVYVVDGDAFRAVGRDGDGVLGLFEVGPASVAVARKDGTIDRLDRATLGLIDTADSAATRTAAAAFVVADSTALMLDGPRGVDAVDGSGATLARFNTRPAGLRMLATAGGHLIGVSADRATVAVWDATASRDPVLTINVLARTGNHVTDLIADEADGPGPN